MLFQDVTQNVRSYPVREQMGVRPTKILVPAAQIIDFASLTTFGHLYDFLRQTAGYFPESHLVAIN